MTKIRFPILLLPLLINFASIVWGNDPHKLTDSKVIKSVGQLAVFELKHRTGQELLLLIRPFLDPKAVIRASQNKLIIRTNRENLDEVTRLISRLDAVQRTLKITLRQTTIPTNDNGSDYRLHNKQTIFSQRKTVTTSSSYRQQQGVNQSLYVVENKIAWLSFSKEFPVVSDTNRGIGHGTSIRRKSLATGFRIRARLIESGVAISISSTHERHNESHGSRTTGNASSTTINARLGVWVTIGQSSLAYTLKSFLPDHSYDLHHTASDNAGHTLQIKVDLVPNQIN